MATKNQKKSPKASSKSTPRETSNTRDRASPQFSVLRQALIHILAGEGERTADIAEALGVNRSYVIRLTSFSMKPANASERAVLKLAKANEAKLRRLGMSYAFGEGFETTLAGDDGRRGHGGGRPRKDATPAPAKKAAPKAKAPAPAKKAAPKAKAPAPAKKAAPKAKAPAPAKKISAKDVPLKKGPPRRSPDAPPVRAPKKTQPKAKTPKPSEKDTRVEAAMNPSPDSELMLDHTLDTLGV